ncbi:ESX secretion-associated protein EspG [Nocardia flavorosea]|uniref:ESX secretion-associated protein EspG n=1 Tax=Nocardia flavorosea TaxID=53429 RepID=A0A846Y6X5_9NOCA|nr:ESX secretion-associated protein EspG [Nocardia flavorosea]NKY54953.1 ESX secretion-associated protein EspG [Nocardia flavorosea]
MRTLGNDALLVLAEQLDIQTLPNVLGAGPQQDSYDDWHTARDSAVADLRAGGIIDPYGDVESDLAQALYILAKPERELLARSYGGQPGTRVCVALRAGRCALAVRAGADFEIGTLWSDGTADSLTTPILSALPACAPADVAAFSAPTSELANGLDNAEDTGGFADAFYALGAAEREATILGAAFGSCFAVTEIVARASADGIITRARGSVVVYDTDRGRVVAAPMVTPDQQVWTTVTSGTGHRVTQAVATLLEGLPGGRWLTPSHSD